MTDAEVIQILRKHVERQFPKECPSCHRQFASLREYIIATKPVGDVISYDAESGDWKPVEPLGTTAMANCPCGSTLTITSDGIPLLQLWRLLSWSRVETKRRGLSQKQLLEYVRGEIRRQVLAEPGGDDGPC
jgi:hypothetical protein